MTILCTIDLLTREVFLPADQCIAAYDHNVDVIRFQAEPIEDFSLNLSSIKIAAQGPNKARHDYAVDPATVSIEEETGYITFDWPIPAGVTEMPLDVFKYGDKGNLIFAVCAEIIDGSTVSKAWHSDDGIITVVAHLEPESGGGEDPSETATNAQKIGQLQTDMAVVQREISGIANGTPPTADSTSEMDPDESTVYINTTDGKWYYWDGSAWQIGGQYGGAVTDTTLSVSGAPADAKAVGDDLDALDDRVTALESGSSGGLTADIKSALLACFRHIAFLDDDDDYYQNLYDALYPPVPPALLTSISAVYTQSKVIYTDSSLDDLKSDLVVTAYYNNGTSSPVTTYVLGGELTVGTSIITVTYGGKTTTFEVTVTRGIDYTEDALTNATWNNGYGYNNSGSLVSRSGAYTTDKFTVQDLSYNIANLDTTNNTTFYIYVWDENDTFIGSKQASTARFQWKSNYKIAIEVRNAGTFDPSTITMLPVDKRETAVDAFEINLASLANSVTKANGYYEVNVKTLMNDVGVTSSNYTNTLNRQSIIGMIGEAVTTSNFPFKTPIRIGTFHYSSNMLLSIFVEGISVSDANLPTLKQYLIDNDVKIRYNY